MSDVELEIVDDRLVPGDVHDLLDDVQSTTGHRPLSDHLWLDLVQGGRPGAASVLAWSPADAGPRVLQGFCQLSRNATSWAIEVVVARSVPDGVHIGDALVAAGLAHVGRSGGGHVHWWVFAPTDASAEIARRNGLAEGRTLHQMRVPLPLDGDVVRAATDGLALRAFRAGADEVDWLEVNNAAFSRHPEQGNWDAATLRQREREDWFDASGFLLHHRDGRLAAFCWTKVHRDVEPVLGEIYVIAVHPDFHGLGLGRSLTVAGLDWIAHRGVTTGMLYVDRDNAAAFGLYQALGFTVHRTDRAYVGDVAPIPSRDLPEERA